MNESGEAPSSDRLATLVTDGERAAAIACLDRVSAAGPEQRKRALHSLRTVANEAPALFRGLTTALEPFLTDEQRAVRLSTAKLFVAVAESEPGAVRPAVAAVAQRLDDGEFYYVRARCAETLGYVALEHPEAVSDPETLADLRLGLSFDEPEVKEKLAKALAYVALGDPERLRHQVGSLADHLDDESELVRYHLCTALVAIGCGRPEKLATAVDALGSRLSDESAYVRGRAAEALAVFAESDESGETLPELDGVESMDGETPSFLTDRVRFLRRLSRGEERSGPETAELGTVESVRAGTEAVVESITSPDGDGECAHCGLALPERGPPMCPRCGAPH